MSRRRRRGRSHVHWDFRRGRKKYAQVLAKFDSFFQPRKNVIFERARFNRRQQAEGETAEQFIVALYHLASTCNYGPLQDEMIRDRLVVGIRDSALSERLQLDPELTLDKAKKMVQQKEAVKDQQTVLKGDTHLDALRGHATNSSRRLQQSQREPLLPPRRDSYKQCMRCGKPTHPRDKCPARDAICHRCNRKGHYSSQCLSKTVFAASQEDMAFQQDSIISEEPVANHYLDAIGTSQESSWSVKLHVDSQEVTFKIDTGAEVTAISEKVYQDLQRPTLQKSSKFLHGPGQHPLPVVGQFHATLHHGQNSSSQQIFVIKNLKHNLLGLPAITALHLAARLDSTYTAMVQNRFPSVFQGLGNLGEPYIHNQTPTELYSLCSKHAKSHPITLAKSSPS